MGRGRVERGARVDVDDCLRCDHHDLSVVHSKRKFGAVSGVFDEANHRQRALRAQNLGSRRALERNLPRLFPDFSAESAVFDGGVAQSNDYSIRVVFSVGFFYEFIFNETTFLFLSVRPRTHEIIQFFHKNTECVEGIGDVCSYSLMDVSRYGDKRLAELNKSMICTKDGEKMFQNFVEEQRDCGKIELSLVNFALMNPTWLPPKAGVDFIQQLKEKVGVFFFDCF